MHKLLSTALAAYAVAIPLHAAIAQTPPQAAPVPAMFPFTVPWDDASTGVATDVSFLNAKPAGVNGYIVVKNGHFAESTTGARVRFLGVNITFGANFPEHADAEKLAAHLAKLGVNIVRIHHHDIDHSMLWDKTAKGHTKFDADAIDRQDYLLAQFKKYGIYIDLNLHVSRSFVPDDGFPDSVTQIRSDFDKRIDNVDRHMIDLQKQFAHDYLTRINPYTHLSYVDDPAVAIIEINNENDLAWEGHTSIGFCDSLPEPFRTEVVKDWNEWLARKYKSSADIAAAWYKVAPNAAPPANLLSPASTWGFEDQSKVGALISIGSNSAKGPDDVAISNGAVAAAAWHTQAHVIGLNLQEGTLYTLSFRAKASSPRRMPVYASCDQPDWHHVGLDVQAPVGTDWAAYRYTFQAQNTVPNHTRISFMLGEASGTVLLRDVQLASGSSGSAFAPGANLESRSIDIPVSATASSLADWQHFIVDTETAYADEMRAYVRGDLKAHANLIDTQMSYGGMAGFKREAGSDFTDMHAYWQQPNFPGRAWDQSNWFIKNIPMTDALVKGDDSELQELAVYRVAGRPFTVSEIQEAAPNDYQAEFYPEIASYAAYQDWDALFEFDYGNYGGVTPHNQIQGFFGIQGNPAKESFLPVAALMFRGGELAPASKKLTLHLPASSTFNTDWAVNEWTAANGGKLPSLFDQRFESMIDPAASAPGIVSGSSSPAASTVQAVTTPSGTQYLAQGSASVSTAGFVGGETVRLGPVSAVFPTFGNNFAAFTLAAIDQKPLGTSQHLLLTITGKAEDTGVQWNADRSSVGLHWGKGVAQAEGIPATVSIANATITKVWSLDGTGARVKQVPVTLSGGVATFSIGPDYRTVWYELAAN